MRPAKIALLIWCAVAMLGVLCLVLPERMQVGTLTLRWTTLAKVLGETQAPAYADIADTLVVPEVQDTIEAVAADTLETQKPETPKPEPPIDEAVPADNRYLSRFLAALDETADHTVRVVHYGDSQIEEDRMTMTLRRALQARYGGGGVGLVPLHQTIPTRTLSQVLTVNGVRQTTRQGPQRNLVYGPKNQRRTDGMYGVMGQVAAIGKRDSLGIVPDSLSLAFAPMGKKNYSESYFSRLRIWADGEFTSNLRSVQTPLDHRSTTLVLPDSTTRCTLGIVGAGNIYGISLETETGVIVDNIPMRGSIGTVFTDIDSAQLADFYRETDTRLIIMQFGGNAIPHNEKPGTIQGVVGSLRKQVRYLQQCAPEADILFVGPGDMCTLIDGQMTTYPLLPYMDNLLQKMAAQEHIAYFSLYRAMGGRDSMLRWQKNGWAGSDGVHFTRRGAEIAGEKLAAFILENK